MHLTHIKPVMPMQLPPRHLRGCGDAKRHILPPDLEPTCSIDEADHVLLILLLGQQAWPTKAGGVKEACAPRGECLKVLAQLVLRAPGALLHRSSPGSGSGGNRNGQVISDHLCKHCMDDAGLKGMHMHVLVRQLL